MVFLFQNQNLQQDLRQHREPQIDLCHDVIFGSGRVVGIHLSWAILPAPIHVVGTCNHFVWKVQL